MTQRPSSHRPTANSIPPSSSYDDDVVVEQQPPTTTAFSSTARRTATSVQEAIRSALDANNAAVDLLRSNSAIGQERNEVAALSILTGAIRTLSSDLDDVGSGREHQEAAAAAAAPASEMSPSSASSHTSAQQEPSSALLSSHTTSSGSDLPCTTTTTLGQAQRQLVQEQYRSSSNRSGSTISNQHQCDASSNTNSAAAQQLRSPQGISTLDFAALTAYLSSTLTRHDLIVHSVPSQSNKRRALMSTVGMADESDLHTSPGNLYSVYNRPFVVNDQWRAMDVLVWAQSLPHVPAVLYYNAGLCCHRLACRDGSGSSNTNAAQQSTLYYRQALEFYSVAGRLLEGNARAGVYLTELDILLLAVTNNVGHIYSHFSGLDEARFCLERMLAVFFLSECKALMTKDEYVFFHINILLFVNRWPILAGAA